jgi:Ulp1 family protease
MQLVVPVNIGNTHWKFAVLGSPMQVFDSLQGGPVASLLQLQEQMLGLGGEWVASSFPRQNNTYDCGVFMLAGIREYVRGGKGGWSFEAADTGYLRHKFAVELLEGRLLGL